MIKVKDLVKKYGEYEIDETELEKVLIKPKPNTVWHLKDGDCCYIMTEDGLIRLINFDEDAYFSVRELGMLASNEQELIDFREWLKIRAKLLKLGGREYVIKGIKNYHAYYDLIDEIIRCGHNYDYCGSDIYFSSEEECYHAFEQFDRDYLLKYWFKVED